MNVFLLAVVYSLFVGVLHADFGVTEQKPSQHITVNTHYVSITISQTVNQPTFSAYIKFYNASNNTLINTIDASSNSSNVTYSNQTLSFPIPQFNINDTFYITFDAGVFFSNGTNSSAQTNSSFWQLTVTALDSTTTSTTTTTTTTTTITTTTTVTTNGTTTTVTVITSTTANISTTTTTAVSNTSTTTITTASTSGATTSIYVPGEPSPTRSAQVGMGLGITFITIVIIIEIVYFKYCYSGAGRSGNYFT